MCSVGGAGSRHSDGCGCRRTRVEGFIRPCLLLLLSERTSHGYELMDDLAKFFGGQIPDMAAVYRNLRWLEEADFVTSAWETGGPGPARRVYKVTGAGRELLNRQAADLRLQKERLELFLQRHERFLNITGGDL